jgi:hypothetical protein
MMTFVLFAYIVSDEDIANLVQFIIRAFKKNRLYFEFSFMHSSFDVYRLISLLSAYGKKAIAVFLKGSGGECGSAIVGYNAIISVIILIVVFY